jgi:excisionase family DNA binding protein
LNLIECFNLNKSYHLIRNNVKHKYYHLTRIKKKVKIICMVEKKGKLLSVTQVAELGGISRTRVLQLIESGLLVAERVGDAYVIRQADFEAWSNSRRGAGRPKKETQAK